MTNVTPSPIRRGKYMDFAPRARQKPQNAKKSVSSVPTRPAQKRPLQPASVTVKTHFDTPTHHVHQSVTESTARTENSISYARSTTTVAVPHSTVPVLEDDGPFMSDADLEAALAGFADAPGTNTDSEDFEIEDSTPVNEAATAETPEESPADFLDDSPTEFAAELEALEELTDGLPEENAEDELDELAEEADEKDTEPQGKKTPETPDNHRFILGGRSPFLTNVALDKRPLSGDFSEQAVEQAIEEEKPKKNSYLHRKLDEVKAEKPKKEKKPATIVISTPDRASNFGLVVAIILTIILGSTVGAVVYLAFFQ